MAPDRLTSPTEIEVRSARRYREHRVPRGRHHLYARDYPGADPAIVLMHGFPDDLHLYDRLLPHLNPPRRVVTFDFLGWGGSDKPTGYRYTAANQTGELDAVISQLGLDQVTVVVHGRPVRIVFGAADPYLNTRVARRFHQLLPTSELFLLDGARHYVQMDKPEDVARLILAIPEG
jgi:pimeloyl-ACP methyl ester carboxylesterase